MVRFFIVIIMSIHISVLGQSQIDTVYLNEAMEPTEHLSEAEIIGYRTNKGICKYYLKSGELFIEQYEEKGKRQGEYKRYHQNGELELTGDFKNDKPVGEHHYYDILGEYIRSVVFNKRHKVIAEYYKTENGKKVFSICRRQSAFGGYRSQQKALTKMSMFIEEELVKPDLAYDFDEPFVHVGFLIAPDGSLEDIEILQAPHVDMEKAVLRVIKKMPTWRPASFKGQKVYSEFSVIVNF